MRSQVLPVLHSGGQRHNDVLTADWSLPENLAADPLLLIVCKRHQNVDASKLHCRADLLGVVDQPAGGVRRCNQSQSIRRQASNPRLGRKPCPWICLGDGGAGGACCLSEVGGLGVDVTRAGEPESPNVHARNHAWNRSLLLSALVGTAL